MNDENAECEPSEDSLEEGKPILIVGFTGEETHQFLKITRTTSGIYIRPQYRGIGPHVSYHASGEMHTILYDQQGRKKYSDSKKGLPLAQFQEEANLGVWTIYALGLPIRKELTASIDRKSQIIYYFDMTRLSGNPCINVRLIENGRVDLIEKLFKTISTQLGGQILAITDQTPWITLILAIV